MKKLSRLLQCLALMAGLAAWGNTAYAACATPVGGAGDIRYASNYNVMVYCNGADWVSMAGWNTGGGGGATLLNELTDVDTSGAAAGSFLRYDGANWIVSSTTETDPQVGTLTNTKWCTTDGSAVNCAADAPLLTTATLNDLADVDTAGAATGKVIAYNGTNWVVSDSGGVLGDSVSVTTLNSRYLSSTQGYIGALTGGTAAVGGLTVTGASSLSNVSITNLLQTGMSAQGCTTGISGSIRYNNTSDTLQICTSGGWKSLVSGTTGGAASTLSGLTDTDITSVANRDYLRYDAATSKWVNISESTAMSTTTMIQDWPDAITCNVTSPAYGTVVFYAMHMPYSADGLYYYRLNQEAGTARSVVFNSNGTFNAYNNLTTTNCNVSISSLYSSGRAFNFIGGGATAAVSSTGAIQFNVANSLAGDGANLFWDDTNNRLGIGTGAPNNPLTVRGTGVINTSGTSAGYEFYDRTVGTGLSVLYRTGNVTGLWDNTSGVNRFSINNNTGNIGIGTDTPSYALQVVSTSGVGLLSLSNNVNSLAYLDLSNPNTGASAGSIIRLITSNAASSGNTTVDIVKYKNGAFILNNNDTDSAAYTALGVGASERLRIDSSGNVGIGNTNPGAKLSVGTASSGGGIYIGAMDGTNEGSQIEWEGAASNDNWTTDLYAQTFRFITNSANTNQFQIFNNGAGKAGLYVEGNTGIGTSAPNGPLEVVTSGGQEGIVFYQPLNNTNAIQGYIDNQWANRTTYASGCCNSLLLQPDVGQVGIRTTTPNATLDVNGTISATSVEVGGVDLGINELGAVTLPAATTYDFTGIPAGVKRVTVILQGVSLNSTSQLRVQLGTSGGIVTSGYSGVAGYRGSESAFTAGFDISSAFNNAANGFNVIYTFVRLDSSTWVGTFAFNQPTTPGYGTGMVALGGTLDRVRITNVAGTNTFDAGKANVLYER